MSESNASRIWNLIKIPAVITLAITIARFAGELRGLPKWLASAELGGGAALLGITWLVPVFGIYLAIKLVRAGEGPSSFGRAWGIWVASLALFVGGAFPSARWPNSILAYTVTMLIAAAAFEVAIYGWKSYANALIGYGLAARIPVAIVMAIATYGGLKTHYSAYPPALNSLGTNGKYLLGGLLTQLTAWIAFTVVVGALFGLPAAMIASKKKGGASDAPPPQPAARAAGTH